ncbi:MAG: dihydroorotate dehydrogenase [Candidatus Methanomethylicia archaeon]
MSVSISLGTLFLRNPTILASGILGTTASLLIRAYKSGAGAVVSKSISIKPNEGYKTPVLIDLGYGYINSMGLPNPGLNEMIAEFEIVKSKKVRLFGSIFASDIDEFKYLASKLTDYVDALELNLSCPTKMGVGLEIGKIPWMVEEVTREVCKKSKVPVIAKLPPLMTLIDELTLAAEDGGASAVTLTNTVKAMKIDIFSKKPVLQGVYGGLSGKALKPLSLACVFKAYEVLSIPIIGCGGIYSWEDAVEYILAGAKAIQIGSAIATEGLGIFRKICTGIKKYLEENNIDKINDLVGLAHRR